MHDEPRPPPAPDCWENRPLEWPRVAGRIDQLQAALATRQRRQRRRRVLGAALALTATAGLWFVAIPRVPPAAPPPAHSARMTVVAPERRVLPDGSVAELRPGAALTVEFAAESAGPRLVILGRGTVHFAVAKNPDRPFIVTVGDMQFRAVGTAFAVSREAAAVEMLVTEGRVAVEAAHPTATYPAATVVAAGSRVRLEAAAPVAPAVAPVTSAEARALLAWRVPRLEFNDTPLREVLALLKRHGGRVIVPADDAVGGIAISGALRADNPEPLLAVLETSYGIVADRRPDGSIGLRRGR
jgi:transmembrane sensor